MTLNAGNRIRLEWSRLLGFDQVKADAADAGQLKDARLAKVGGKKCISATR